MSQQHLCAICFKWFPTEELHEQLPALSRWFVCKGCMAEANKPKSERPEPVIEQGPALDLYPSEEEE